MPIEGEIRQDRELGLGRKYSRLIWLACRSCGKERWVRLNDRKKSNCTGLCHTCVLRLRNGKGHLSPNWKGGVKYGGGYIWVFLTPDNPFYPMANMHGYVKRARLVMAEHIGRCLKPEEDVHHENEIKTDDNDANLRLFPSKATHMAYHRHKEMSSGRQRQRNVKGQFMKEVANAYQ